MQEVSGVVLAGGQSTRMGRHKALLVLDGETLLQRVVARVQRVAAEVIVVANEPAVLAPIQGAHVRIVADRVAGAGPLAGLHAGLLAAQRGWALVVACDMPYLNVALLRYLIALADDTADVILPRGADGLHTLHALYHRRCLPHIERCLQAQRRQMIAFLDDVRTRYVSEAEMAPFDPQQRSFFNANTGDDWRQVLDAADRKDD